MSRTAKLYLLGVPFVAAVLWVAAIGMQAFAVHGSVASAPGAITGSGWVQVVVAMIAALESGKGWLAVFRSAADSVVAKLPDEKQRDAAVSAINVATLGYYKWQLSVVSDPQQKQLICQAARLECDALRDREFPPGA